MLRFYWNTVYRSHLGMLALIVAMALLSALLQVASLSMVIPILGVLLSEGYDLASLNLPLVGRFAGQVQQLPKMHLVVALFALAGGMLVLKNGFFVVHQYVSIRLLTKVRFSLTSQLFSRYLLTNYSTHTDQAKGATMSNVWEPAIYVAETMRAGADLIAALLQVVTIVLLMLLVSWQLTLMSALILLPAAFLMDQFFRTRLREIGERSYQLAIAAQALMGDVFDGIRHVKAYVAESQVMDRFAQVVRAIFRNETYHARLRYLPAPLLETLAVVLVILLLLLAMAVPYFRLDFAYFVAFILALQRLNPAVSTVVASKMALDKARKNVEVVSDLLDHLPAEENPGSRKPPQRVSSLAFNHVSFAYPGRPSQKVLESVSLELERGRVTALVGATGAGKSTVADLIIRLFKPSEGAITADGTNIYAFDLYAWRRQVAFVSQDVFLFNTSIRDNIALAKSAASMEAVIQAANLARIHDFIETLPEGYKTEVGDRGVKLSGGQRQRVAIARALLAEASVLIFDEATSALDSQTERAIQETIEGLRRERIVLVIAHRLSTIVKADNVVVLDGGRIVEQGDHASLLARQGVYWRLYSTSGEQAVPARAAIAEDSSSL